MCPSCPLQILWIVHTIVIKLDLPYPKVMREKLHPEKLRDPMQVTLPNPLQQFPHSLNIQVELTSLTSLASVSTSTLLDSRATGMFINWSFVQKHQLKTTPLPQPVLVCNVDGSANENRSVT